MQKMISIQISKSQARDTGMAMVLILLILGFFLENSIYFKAALAALLVTMIIPSAFKYVAIIWLAISTFLGTISSKIILTVVFLFVVVPVSIYRKILGKDTLKLKLFKKGGNSVMEVRDLTFTKENLEKPY